MAIEMKLKRVCIILMICLAETATKAVAQDIYFCSSYTNEGKPVGASKSWSLDKNGGYVFILFNSHKRHIKAKSLVIQLMKKTGSQYQRYEKRAMELHLDKNWAILDYQFTEAGDYDAIVQDKTGKELGSDFVTIKLAPKTEDSTGSIWKNEVDPTRNYYHAKTIFCKSILNGNPVDSGSVFPYGEINVIIRNDQALATDSIIVDVFKKGYESEKYPIYMTTKNFRIDKSLPDASFSLVFDQTGQYKIVAYNNRSQTIAIGYISVR